jgi:hypothetical protein
MILSDYKLIYLHPSKTGGSSIETALAPYSECQVYPRMMRFAEHICVQHGKKQVKHHTLEYYRRLLGNKLPHYRVFITTRNPWERFLSAWAYDWHKPYQSFDDFVFSWRSRPGMGNGPVVDFLKIDGTIRRSPFIHFDNLEQGFKDMCERVGLPEIELPHVLKSEHGPYQQYYSVRSRDFIAEKFREDIEFFGYTFG